jgi:hypothetical protein
MVGNDNTWDRLASDIESAVGDACKQFRKLPAESIEARPNPGDWSVKEILGHLIDSAANNHQRFVRLQVADNLAFPDYSQDNHAWISIQKYQEAPWDELLSVWRYYNLHLARIIRTVDPDCTEHVWVVDKNTSISLGDLMTDYLRHLEDHLQQIKQNITAK